MLNWIVWNLYFKHIIYIKMDLALNNQQGLICHKNPTNQPTNPDRFSFTRFYRPSQPADLPGYIIYRRTGAVDVIVSHRPNQEHN